MMDEKVRTAVIEAIRAQRLPDAHPARTWGGPGNGAPCRICGAKLGADEAELELEFAAHGAPLRHTVHARCFAVWEVERARLAAEVSARPQPRSPAAAAGRWASAGSRMG